MNGCMKRLDWGILRRIPIPRWSCRISNRQLERRYCWSSDWSWLGVNLLRSNCCFDKGCQAQKLCAWHSYNSETILKFDLHAFLAVFKSHEFSLNIGSVQQRKDPPDLMISVISTSMTSKPRERS